MLPWDNMARFLWRALEFHNIILKVFTCFQCELNWFDNKKCIILLLKLCIQTCFGQKMSRRSIMSQGNTKSFFLINSLIYLSTNGKCSLYEAFLLYECVTTISKLLYNLYFIPSMIFDFLSRGNRNHNLNKIKDKLICKSFSKLIVIYFDHINVLDFKKIEEISE